MNRQRRFLALLGACVTTLALLRAQTAGRLSGSVVDSSGASLPNAQVSLFLHDSGSAILVTQTTSDGTFYIGTIRPDLYDLTVEAANFATAKVVDVKIDAVAETSLPAITLQIAKSSQSVNVIESVIGVDTSTTGASTRPSPKARSTIYRRWTARSAPCSRPKPVSPWLAASRSSVNGMRTTTANDTYDGVNIQYATIRQGVLDSIGLPNKTTLDQVQEVTMSTSNPNSALGNGASQVVLVTPSGTNSFHGEHCTGITATPTFAANGLVREPDGRGKSSVESESIRWRRWEVPSRRTSCCSTETTRVSAM